MDEIRDELAGVAPATPILDAIRIAVRANPHDVLPRLGLTAGGEIYRSTGDGHGTYVRAWYLDPKGEA